MLQPGDDAPHIAKKSPPDSEVRYFCKAGANFAAGLLNLLLCIALTGYRRYRDQDINLSGRHRI
jgi:hypothetical protein